MKLNTLRPRRLRRTAAIRSMVRETSLEIYDFIYPIFVVPGPNVKEEIPSMPGCYHLSVDQAVKQAEEIVSGSLRWKYLGCLLIKMTSVLLPGIWKVLYSGQWWQSKKNFPILLL